MRPVGIIFVFLNLILSIATCALIVVVYTTRTNWKKEYDRAKDLALVAEAAYKSEKQTHDNDLKGREERISALNSQIDSMKNAVSTAEAAKVQALKDLADYKKTTTGDNSDKASMTAQITQLGKELESLKAERQNREAMIIQLEKEKNVERKDRVEAEQRLAGLQSRNQKLANDFADLTNKYQSIEKQMGKLGLSNPSILNNDAPPPPKGVAGSVTAVNDRGLTEISIGSDSGIKEGNELFVARFNEKNPSASTLLGTLRISRSEPKKAIGYFTPAATSNIKKPSVGDTILTSLASK
ncbi:hypothetical protein KIH39_25580 [Telmatocola sphagniphila]|jgi:predicted RNase H-like nuclease (RuvC/YqgF family)|uniref:Uncharacterized protein n=1 Tax=Telmatocola sphagniphila TaxID=1123043 RepID=A0A8E6EV56_9BACT|nr:hypothetical protein [Telmatocola sphagniphila]QVL32167.1 hypothetical protein KIH39_25580 [Telmatocola sphagniphila]